MGLLDRFKGKKTSQPEGAEPDQESPVAPVSEDASAPAQAENADMTDQWLGPQQSSPASPTENRERFTGVRGRSSR
ncbi:MAG: hypothetical protein ACFHWZ_06530 [Phycisphaerales bacterium]